MKVGRGRAPKGVKKLEKLEYVLLMIHPTTFQRRGGRKMVRRAGWAEHFGEHGEWGRGEMLEDRGRPFRRTYDMHFEGHEAG